MQVALPMCCLIACAEQEAPPPSDDSSVTGKASAGTTATIENTLPADGCAFVVYIQDKAYAPDAATLTAARALHFNHDGTTTVKVDYKLTGRTGRVECGFNTHRDLPEVALVFKDA